MSKEKDKGKHILQLGDVVLWEGTKGFGFCCCCFGFCCFLLAELHSGPANRTELREATQLLLSFSHREKTGHPATPLWKWLLLRISRKIHIYWPFLKGDPVASFYSKNLYFSYLLTKRSINVGEGFVPAALREVAPHHDASLLPLTSSALFRRS